MLLLRQRGADDAWRQLALAEQWLAEPTEEPPSLPIWTCRRTNERPHLDGVLDEPFWRGVRPAVLEFEQQDGMLPSHSIFSAERQTDRTEIRLAYDKEFLFLAAEVHAPSAIRTAPHADDNATGARRRDEDLAGCDRIALAIDLDRDLTTYYELTIDNRGRAHEAAWHDARWNPKWYIAHAQGEADWTIEAAVPLAELAAAPPVPRDVWCIAARRIDSDGRAASWHGPATAEPSAASFGLLTFE
jgi:hypothetical protein